MGEVGLLWLGKSLSVAEGEIGRCVGDKGLLVPLGNNLSVAEGDKGLLVPLGNSLSVAEGDRGLCASRLATSIRRVGERLPAR